jgi:UPF0716 protein FxsA
MIWLFLLLILLPLAEIYVLLQAGGIFGVWSVILAVVGTAVLGGILIRWQGFQAIRKAREDIAGGGVPVESAADGVFLVIAAPFLMTPGFITDAMGFLLLVPFIRHYIARQALAWLRGKVEKGEATINFRRL